MGLEPTILVIAVWVYKIYIKVYSSSEYNLITFLFRGKLNLSHYFLIALSLTLYSFAIVVNGRFLILFFKSSLVIRLFFIAFSLVFLLKQVKHKPEVASF